MLPVLVALPALNSISISDQIWSHGIWTYLLIFLVILFASTIVGGAIPDNTFLFLVGAAAIDNNLSLLWLAVVTVLGGYAGYEINYWSGRLFGLRVCQKVCGRVIRDKNVENALRTMETFGPVSLVLSRFMPVLNMGSFVAGVHAMAYRKYIIYNFVSSVIWCCTLLVLGYYTGQITVFSQYLDVLTDIFLVIMAIAILVVLLLFVRDNVTQKKHQSPEQ